MRNVNWRGSMRFPLRYGNCWNWIHSSSLQLNYLKCHRWLSLWRDGARSVSDCIKKNCHSESPQSRPTNVDSEFRQEAKAAPKRKKKISADLSAKFRIRRGTWKRDHRRTCERGVGENPRKKAIQLMSCLRWEFSNYTNLKKECATETTWGFAFWRAATRRWRKVSEENIFLEKCFGASINIFCAARSLGWEERSAFVACSIVQCQCLVGELRAATCNLRRSCIKFRLHKLLNFWRVDR